MSVAAHSSKGDRLGEGEVSALPATLGDSWGVVSAADTNGGDRQK